MIVNLVEVAVFLIVVGLIFSPPCILIGLARCSVFIGVCGGLYNILTSWPYMHDVLTISWLSVAAGFIVAGVLCMLSKWLAKRKNPPAEPSEQITRIFSGSIGTLCIVYTVVHLI